ncbi:hypothetical protein KP509_38G005000 [Ceratopteris richardii]|uniref:Uncharacterized protein n=1 Tax=Ceratopteris richardii TaxID=49495 RepID=A0A8T2Q2A5_CERRI|nr:hypothetical protein KP509_38G005000 [Ceratopteris richardii]
MPNSMQKLTSKLQKKRTLKPSNMFDMLFEEVANPFSSDSGGLVAGKENKNPNVLQIDRNPQDDVKIVHNTRFKQDEVGWTQVVYKKKPQNPLPSSNMPFNHVTRNLDMETFAQDLYKTDQDVLANYSFQAFN